MRHVKIIIILGILVALLPFLGFPSSWKSVILVFLGLVISVVAFRVLIVARVLEFDTPKTQKENNDGQKDKKPTVEVTASHE